MSRLAAWDARLFARVHRAHTPLLDTVLPPLGRAADHSKLWLVSAAGLWLVGGRFRRRAALRGVLAIGLTSVTVNGPLKAVAKRQRPPRGLVPLHRLTREHRTFSFPSGHSASAFAFAAAVTQEQPALGLAVLPLAAGVAWSRVHTGAHYPFDVLAGSVLGATAGLATRRWWPVAPHEPAESRPRLARGSVPPLADGAGLTVVVNPAAGPALSASPAEALRAALPGAEVVELAEPERIVEVLARAAAASRALGVAGGDGSVNAAAAAAQERDVPLVVVPAGTLNHLARDLGVSSVEEAADAVRDGETVAVDVAEIDGRPFLNTASLGGYPDLVDARERLEGRIGKWPALVVALVRVLRSAEPLDVELDGVPRRIWMMFVGNCRYHPSGFAPSWRERLDDGRLDVRIVDAARPWGRARLVLAVLTGRLGRSRVYEQRLARSVSVRSLDGPVRLARDGETFDGSASFTVRKRERPLAVYVPR